MKLYDCPDHEYESSNKQCPDCMEQAKFTDVNTFLDRLKEDKDSVVFISVKENDIDGYFRAIAYEDDLESGRIGVLLIGLDRVRKKLLERLSELRTAQELSEAP